MSEDSISPRHLRGLAGMSPQRRQAIARKGGQTVQARGTGHRWTAEEARRAGKKASARYAVRRRPDDSDIQQKEGAKEMDLKQKDD